MQTPKITPTTPSRAEIEAWLCRQLEDHWSDVNITCVIGVHYNNVVMEYYHETKFYSHVIELLSPHAVRLGLDDNAFYNLTNKIHKYLKRHPECKLQK